ncbi:MAG: ethanolamine utilization protein EutN [Firmicutes bacterium HGW-Firmicutes-2]|jgi:ethanolamine utilization protein EutN|nr:MAG: ethanolamine utilization protein EutN [Firmicutes bacterium HGW-Firmicutes-2]
MIIGKVIGRIVSTRKHERLVGNKFLVCEVKKGDMSDIIVAVDTVGAGIGESVLITLGSSARVSMNNSETPVDASIIGIVDEENDLEIFS